MPSIVTIEYCRGCSTNHPHLEHDESSYFKLFKEVETLLKQEGYMVCAERWPKIGSFEVKLNRKIVFSKMLGHSLP